MLLIFTNFTALPGIAAIFDFEIPQTNVVISEEETHTSSLSVIFEKVIPKPLDIHDFISFIETSPTKEEIKAYALIIYLHPHLSIFSPPPEVLI